MVTTKQIAALKYLIFESKKDNPLAKRILALLLDKSEGLTKQVYISLQQDREGYLAEDVSRAAYAFGAMHSCNGTTHLSELMAITGTEFSFSVHYGSYDANGKFCNKGQFPGGQHHPDHTGNEPVRYTFWLEAGYYGHAGGEKTEIKTSREELEKINLNKPGLYPTLEK